jgi:hypothetical protein
MTPSTGRMLALTLSTKAPFTAPEVLSEGWCTVSGNRFPILAVDPCAKSIHKLFTVVYLAARELPNPAVAASPVDRWHLNALRSTT